MSGLGVTASLLARPDLELLGMQEMVHQAGLIASAVGIPVIADADTGYGGLANVERTVRAYLQAGVAAIHLEDLVVQQNRRQEGIGTLLLDRVVDYARERGVKRLGWEVLDWNHNAIKFYESKGAKILKEWRVVQMDDHAIANYSKD
jgi:GNAT superfamily N-acetyltransferase